MKRAASLYVRLSRQSREEQTGLGSQEQDLRNLAAARGLAVAEVRVDDGESGALRNRPGLLAWLQDARDGRVDHLLAWKLDRVSRGGSAALAEFLDTLEGIDRDGKPVSAPVRFLSVADGLDSESGSWGIQAAVMAEIAKSEREAIRTRILRSKKALRDAGRWQGGPVPTAFRAAPNPEGPGKVLVPVPSEVAILREAAAILTARGLRAATRFLEASTLRPSRVEHWQRMTVRQALTSDAAKALIFSPAERADIRQALEPKGGSGGRGPSRLLSGILRCASCGQNMHVVGRGGKASAGTRRYMCSGRRHGYGCETPTGASCDLLETYVEREWLAGWGEMDEMTLVQPAAEHRNRVALLEEQIADAKAAYMAAATRAERAEATVRVDELEDALDALESQPSTLLTFLRTTGRTYADAWRDADLDDRRDLLRQTVGFLTVARATTPGRTAFDPARLLDGYKLAPAPADDAL